MSTNSPDIYRQIQKILASYFLGLPESELYYALEVSYQHEFKRNLDYHSLGMNGIADLVDEMRRKGMVLFLERPENNETFVMCTRTLKRRQTDLRLVVQEILVEHGGSIPLFDFEVSYKKKVDMSLNYHLYGLKDFKCLCKLLNLVLSEEPESQKTLVMSARTLKSRQKSLKLQVQELLNEHGGSIPLIDFEVSYKDKFKAKLDYHYFGLKDFDSLCEVLNMVVEAANFPGEKVIKAGEIYNSRKRKR